MTIGNALGETEKVLFESMLIKHIAQHSDFMNDYDRLAVHLSKLSGKQIDGRKITYMARGEAYAKKWLIMCLLKTALKYAWLPKTVEDWTHVIWTITGKKQSIYGGDNTYVYKQLADLSEKPEIIFENCYQQMLEESHYGCQK